MVWQSKLLKVRMKNNSLFFLSCYVAMIIIGASVALFGAATLTAVGLHYN